jgi:hypothetical protein
VSTSSVLGVQELDPGFWKIRSDEISGIGSCTQITLALRS